MTRGEGRDKDGNKGEKVLGNEHVWMTHGHGQQWELTVGAGGRMGERGQKGKNWDNCNRLTIKNDFNKYIYVNRYKTYQKDNNLSKNFIYNKYKYLEINLIIND